MSENQGVKFSEKSPLLTSPLIPLNIRTKVEDIREKLSGNTHKIKNLPHRRITSLDLSKISSNFKEIVESNRKFSDLFKETSSFYNDATEIQNSITKVPQSEDALSQSQAKCRQSLRDALREHSSLEIQGRQIISSLQESKDKDFDHILDGAQKAVDAIEAKLSASMTAAKQKNESMIEQQNQFNAKKHLGWGKGAKPSSFVGFSGKPIEKKAEEKEAMPSSFGAVNVGEAKGGLKGPVKLFGASGIQEPKKEEGSSEKPPFASGLKLPASVGLKMPANAPLSQNGAFKMGGVAAPQHFGAFVAKPPTDAAAALPPSSFKLKTPTNAAAPAPPLTSFAAKPPADASAAPAAAPPLSSFTAKPPVDASAAPAASPPLSSFTAKSPVDTAAAPPLSSFTAKPPVDTAAAPPLSSFTMKLPAAAAPPLSSFAAKPPADASAAPAASPPLSSFTAKSPVDTAAAPPLSSFTMKLPAAAAPPLSSFTAKPPADASAAPAASPPLSSFTAKSPVDTAAAPPLSSFTAKPPVDTAAAPPLSSFTAKPPTDVATSVPSEPPSSKTEAPANAQPSSIPPPPEVSFVMESKIGANSPAAPTITPAPAAAAGGSPPITNGWEKPTETWSSKVSSLKQGPSSSGFGSGMKSSPWSQASNTAPPKAGSGMPAKLFGSGTTMGAGNTFSSLAKNTQNQSFLSSSSGFKPLNERK